MTDADTVERVRAPASRTWPDDDALLTRAQAADLLGRVGLGTTPRTLSYWAGRPDGPPYARVVGRVRYRCADLRQWLTDQLAG